jgi:hypothetical protein
LTAALDSAAIHEALRDGTLAVNDGWEVAGRRYSEITPTLTRWVWDARVPLGAMTPFVGTEGLGKTAVGTRLVADLTRGTLPGDHYGQPINVGLITPEDDAAATIRKRLDAAGADVGRVIDMKMRKGDLERPFSLPDDTDKLAAYIAAQDIGFIWADPLVTLLNARLNSWNAEAIREAMTPLLAVLEEREVTLCGALHTNKNSSTDSRVRSMGSIAWRQLARSYLYVGLDPDDPAGVRGDSRCIAHDKCNLGPQARTMRFTLQTKPVQVKDQSQPVICAALGEECDVRVPEMLEHEKGTDPADSKEAKAETWLERFLADGPRDRSTIREACEAAGHSWRTVQRASKEIGVKSDRPKGVAGTRWLLPHHSDGEPAI